MATALVNGILTSGSDAENIMVCEPMEEKRKYFSDMGITATVDMLALEEQCDVIFFAVKPNVIDDVLSKLHGFSDKIYISIAAGVSIAHLESLLGNDKKIVRTMPNTPAFVGCGMTVVTPNNNLTDEEVEDVCKLLSGVGETEVMPEKFMSVATALHGSSPAYVYMMIDAMADAGVVYGLTKQQALKLAAKAVEGSARMVLETGEHPEKLKDNVCSPGGTTIAAVCDLEKNSFRSTMQSAVRACVEKAEEMSK